MIYQTRKSLLSETADGALVQIATTNILFRKAFFYGYKAVSASAAPTDNTGDVLLGEKPLGGSVVLRDVIGPGGSPLIVESGTEIRLNLKDFWALIQTNGDKVFVVYQ